MLDRLKGVFASFNSHDVRYVVIGGVAAILHGVPRSTLDVDILIETTPQNARLLLDAMTEAGFGTAFLTTPEELLSNVVTVFKDRVRIDVQTSTPGISFQDAWARRQRITYQGQPFYILCRDDVIATKLAAGRPVDLEDVRLLRLDDQKSGGP
jgi:hypothetical protein